MPSQPNTIERALELARSGDFDKPFDIARRLNAEGYFDARAHLEGRAVKAMLRKAMDEALKAKAAAEEDAFKAQIYRVSKSL